MRVPIAQVDAFASEPFTGNPAAVCVLTGETGAPWMQRVAREIAAVTTAFVRPLGGDGAYDLRWFTPRVELKLCGHATLAAAHILWETGAVAERAAVHFQTASGALAAAHNDGWVELDFPATPATAIPDREGPGLHELIEALGVTPRFVGRSLHDYLVELGDEAAVRAVRPDFVRLAAVGGRGVMVTAPASTSGADFVSRFFAPAVGINEDFATGSAHCCLGPFWSGRLGMPTLTGHQLSERGAVIRVSVHADRVRIAGRAVTVMRGELLLRPATSNQ